MHSGLNSVVVNVNIKWKLDVIHGTSANLLKGHVINGSAGGVLLNQL